MVVQPHPLIAIAAREALKVAAEEAKKIVAHYRFYAYSDSTIARNPAFDAPLSAGWAAGSIAAVCSTYVWAAIQAANDVLRAQSKPLIELEGDVVEDARSTIGADGIYRYTEGERRAAAKALFDFTYKRVTDKIEEKIDGFSDLATALITVIPGASGSLDNVKDILGTIVSNQLVNSFASKELSDLGSTWQSTGEGKAVSPDDTKLHWDVNATAVPLPPSIPGKINVYGNQQQTNIPLPGWKFEPVNIIKASVGKGTEGGHVVRRVSPEQDPPMRVVAATVRLGCESRTTDQEGWFNFVDMKQGQYYLEGSILVPDPMTGISTEWKSNLTLFRVHDGDNISNLEVEPVPPPAVGRNITIRTHHDIVDRVTIGKDHWGHFDLNDDIHLVWDPMDAPSSPAASGIPADERNTKLDGMFDQTTPEVGSGVFVRVVVHARLEQTPGRNAPESITGNVICDTTLTFFDAEEGEINAVVVDNNRIVTPSENHTIPFEIPYNLVSDDTVPERASGTITICNHPAVM